MSNRTITELIHLLTWDRRIVKIPREIECDFRHCMLRIPTIADHNIARHIKEEVYDEAIAGGAPTEEQLMREVVAAGMWSTDKEDLIESIEDRVNQLESRLLKEKGVVRRQKTEKEIKEIRREAMRLQNERAAMLVNSADYMAHEQMVFFLLSRLTFDMNGRYIWDDVDHFHEWHKDHHEAGLYLAKHLTNDVMVDIRDIRRVARSGEWRLLWTTNSDNVQALFTPNVRDLSMSQKMLIYWSRIYDSAFESTERPSEDIIEDDEKFDIWFQNRLEEREEKKLNKGRTSKLGQRTAVGDHHERGVMIDGYYNDDCTCGAIEFKGRGLGESKRHDNSCTYGVFVHYSDEEKRSMAEQVYGKNNSKIRKYVNDEQERVADRGLVEEHKLRTKQNRILLGSDQKVHARKR